MRDVALSADGIPVCFKTRGSGNPALVFVHGWSCDRTYWRRQLDSFADPFQVVAIDLAGHGESGGGRAEWTIPAFDNDVVAVVENLGLDKTILIGHSMGGDVVAEAALQLPDRVSGLVWVDVYNSLGEVSSADEIEEFVVPFREDFPATTRGFVRRMFVPSSDADLVEWVVADISAAPPEIAIGSMEHPLSNDGPILARLRELAAPVVAINPDHPPTDVESLGRHGVKTVIMPGVGHFLMMEDPDAFNRLLGETIEGFIR